MNTLSRQTIALEHLLPAYGEVIALTKPFSVVMGGMGVAVTTLSE